MCAKGVKANLQLGIQLIYWGLKIFLLNVGENKKYNKCTLAKIKKNRYDLGVNLKFEPEGKSLTSWFALESWTFNSSTALKKEEFSILLLHSEKIL